jgi:hypothetical protein
MKSRAIATGIGAIAAVVLSAPPTAAQTIEGRWKDQAAHA